MACQQLRSTSLPVRPHALVREVEDELQRLRSGASASASASAPAASLTGRLGDAYGRIEELVRLPGGRGALASARWRGTVEAALDTSVALLDLCQRAMDAAASAKQHVRAARRAVRRGDAALAKAALRGYVRCLAKAGKHDSAKRAIALARRAPADAAETPAAVKVLSDAVAVTVAVLQRAVASLSARAGDARKSSRWRVASRLLRSDRSLGLGVCKDLDGDGATTTLQELEDSVEAVESGLEHLFRQIVRCRVTLLNVLTL